MVVRIRFGRGARIGSGRGRNRRLALAVASLLTPSALMALVLGLWRIAADLRLASDFAISRGFFSHFQVWIAAAVLLQACSLLLNRYGRAGEARDAARGGAPAGRSTAAPGS